MGYEVLDADGGAAERPPRARDPVDPGRRVVPPSERSAPPVVALEDLPEPPPPPPRPHPAGWLPALLRHHVAVELVAVGLAVGAFGGGQVASQHARSRQESVARSTLAVTALSQSYTTTTDGGRSSVDVVVRVFNTGPRTVDVVQSPADDRPRPGHPVVQTFGGTARMQPGEDLALSVQSVLDCRSAEPLDLSVPLRTLDGRLRRVQVQRGQVMQLVPQELCQADDPPREPGAGLTGSLAAPVVELSNPTDRPTTVRLDPSASSPVVAGVLRVTTTPALPVRLAPHSTARLRVRLSLTTCLTDLSSLQATGAYLNLLAQTEEGAGAGFERLSLSVDLSALVGAVVERWCAHGR